MEASYRGRRAAGGGVDAAHITPALAAYALVAARAERVRSLAGKDHDPDLEVLAGTLECVGELDHGLRPKRVAHLGPVDRDLGDTGIVTRGELVADVLVVAGGLPGDCHSAPRLPFPPWTTGWCEQRRSARGTWLWKTSRTRACS